ncbi:Adenylate isopentenyltransferase 5, chloroplastic [Linum perenne]
MNSTLSGAYKQVQFPTMKNFNKSRFNMDPPFFRRKDKVVFVVGPTGTGKSRLAIDLATHFTAEVVNSDKMQVYTGLQIATNKVTDDECRGVPHHLIGVVDPATDFSSDDFRLHASHVVDSVLSRDRLPVIAGGSNSFVDALVNADVDFRSRYDFCFLWVDVALPVLCNFISDRVDRMVKAGLVDEVGAVFDPNDRDYSRGIRRAIGVPELDTYFRCGGGAAALEAAIDEIKENTRVLACRQLKKIRRLHSQWSWSMHRVDATEVFLRRGIDADEIWDELVAGPSVAIVDQFLNRELDLVSATTAVEDITSAVGIPVPAMVAAGLTR